MVILFWKSSFFQGVFGFILKPFWKVESHLAYELRSFMENYLFLLELKKENLRLKNKIYQLEQELAYYKEREALYQQLEKLYRITPQEKLPQVVAKIIYKGIDPYSDLLIIDKGSKDGLMKEMPVLALIGDNSLGLVGQVVEVSRNWSKVLVLTDPSFAVDVKVLSRDERGILKGKGDSTCLLEFLPLYSQAKPGEILITSGQDLLFPKGIIVGTILNISKDPQGLFKRAEVKPWVDLYSISLVSVLLKIPEVDL
ncbi:MAG: rod shape-determining protein MreC [Caldimicrobium sp.]